MKHTIISFLIVCVFATLYGCSDNVSDYHVNSVKMEIKRLKKESKENPYEFHVHLTSMYDSELGCINRKDRLWQDMIFKPVLYADGQIEWDASFFNYGGDVKLYNGFIYDSYVPIGSINVIQHIADLHTIWIKDRIDDEKYGGYAIVEWKTNNGLITDILMTPMAYHAYKTRSGDENLIFVQFKGVDKYLNVIFQGDHIETMVAKRFSNSIRDNLKAGGGNSGYGNYWQSF